jgi:uncharacterized protein
MPDDTYPEAGSRFVFDAVVHAYNFDPDNARSDLARSFLAVTHGMVKFTGHSANIPSEDYARNWSVEELARLLFVESDVDVATYHATPLDDYFFDGLTSNEKGIEMRRRWPDRVLFYGGVNAAADPGEVLERGRSLVEEGGAVGIKLYPERHTESGAVPVRLDSPACAPLFEWAQERGIVVAIHKIVPAGRGRAEHYLLGDVEAAAAMYPDLQIEVVHSGMAFLDETASLMARYSNVWANLEVTSAFAVRAPQRFGDALGRLLWSGAGDRIVFASGCCLVHPQPIIEALEAFEMPESLMDGYGFPQISRRVMDGILGANYARLLGRDPLELRARIAGDEFAQARAAAGKRPAPWSTV